MSLGKVDGQAGAARLLAAGHWATGECLEAVWDTIGAGTSDDPGAYQTAKDWWDRCPADRKHLGDRNPPAGALLRFSNGDADGHICYSLGGQNAASTDKPSAGLTGRTTIADIEASWGGRHYEGWTDWLGGWDVINLGTAPAAPSTTKGTEDMLIGIKGKAGARRGGTYYVAGGTAHYIGAGIPGGVPTFTDEGEIAALQSTISGLR